MFKANYFNGKSSKAYKATIKINSNNWNISFINNFEQTEEIYWKINQIKKSEVYTKGFVSFSFGDTFPFQKIESDDIKFIDFISNSDYKNINNKLDTFLHKSVKKSILILIATIILFSSSIYFYVIPSVAENFVKNLSKEVVINFGNHIFNLLSHDLEINRKNSIKLQAFVDALKIDNEFPIKAYIVEDKQLNAFALSGGKFVIYSALLEKIENEHQLSALIGHEISHIENRHVLKNICRDLSGALFVSIIFGDVNGITSIIGENAHLFSQLSFSRELEKEADIFGLKIMKKNNLDLNGMPELFEILNNHNQIDLPSFLNSHPMLDERIEYTKKIANKQENFITNKVIKEKWGDLKKSLLLNDVEHLTVENNE